MSDAALDLVRVVRTFRQGGETVEVLRGVNLRVNAGEIVALVGPSGAGKSTLLHLAGLLEAPDTGMVRIAGEDTGGMNDDARTRMRRNNIGFVYQYHHLLPEFSALENIVVPQIIAGLGRRKARGRAMELLGALGLADRAKHRPGMLSGGEQQRVAIARALANARRASFSPTNPPAISIRKPPTTCSRSSCNSPAAPASPPWWRPTTATWRRGWTAPSCSTRAPLRSARLRANDKILWITTTNTTRPR